MHEPALSWSDALLYIIAMLAGGIGGAGASSLALLRGRPVTALYVLAYIILGGVLGGIAVASDSALVALGLGNMTGAMFADGGVIHRGLLFGFAGTAMLAGLNLGIARLLRARGWTVSIAQRHTGDEENKP